MKNNAYRNTPILVANTEWPLPESLINDVKQERMVNSLIDMICPLDIENQISWAECVAYLMPATQKNTLKSDVVEIYLYCVNKLIQRKKIKVDIELPEKLSDYQIVKLNEMKKWIFEQRGGREQNPIINTLEKVFSKRKENEK